MHAEGKFKFSGDVEEIEQIELATGRTLITQKSKTNYTISMRNSLI